MYGMTFNGIKKDYIVTLRGKRRPAWAPLTRNLTTIDNMPGAYLESTSVEPRVLDIPILIESKNLAELQKLKEDIADWLITDSPKELIFDDEPDRMYYAMIDGSFDIDEVIRVGVGMLYFKCIDPYKYSAEVRSRPFVSDLENVMNNGTVSTYPLFTAKIKSSITHLDIVSDNAYMRVGKPYSVNETPFLARNLILKDTAASLTGWGQATAVDNGQVTGTMNTDGSGFYPSSFGANVSPKSWQGPSMKKSLSEQLTNFQLDVTVSLLNSTGQTGMIEVYLLDVNNNVVGKIGIEDLYTDYNNTHCKAKVGDASTGKFFADEYALYPKHWLDFKGLLRLTRMDNKWLAYFAITDNKGRHTYQRGSKDNVYYLDTEAKYAGQVAQIQVAFRKFTGTTEVPMRIEDITVWKLNKPTVTQIPYIAHADDVIELDHKTNDIRINGESRVDLKDFGSSYFPLRKGANPIQFNQFGAADLTVEWRERFN